MPLDKPIQQSDTLAKMYERRNAIDTQLKTLMDGTLTTETEARCAQMIDDLDGLESEIRKQGLRDRRDGGGVVMGLGKPAAAMRDEMREWVADANRSPTFELRAAITLSTLGGAGGTFSPDFTMMMDRDATIAKLATVITTESGEPLTFYRQSSQFTKATAAVAENSAAVERNPAANKLTLTPVHNPAYTDVSAQTLRDMRYDVTSQLLQEHAEFQAASWEGAWATGQFSQQAITSVTASTGNAQSKDYASASSAWGLITPAEALATAFSSTMASGYLQSSVWLLPPSSWALIAAQTSANNYIFGGGNNANIARDGAGMTYLGFPVYLTSALATPTATGNAFGIFGDIRRGYRIQRVSGVQFTTDPYTLAINSTIRFVSSVSQAGAIMDVNAMVTLIA